MTKVDSLLSSLAPSSFNSVRMSRVGSANTVCTVNETTTARITDIIIDSLKRIGIVFF